MPPALCLPEHTVPTAKPERQFCVSCGFPLRGPRCEICGGDQTALPLAEGEVRDLRARLDSGDTQGLERAFEAYRSKDFARFVGHVVTAEGGAATRSVTTPDGPGWIAPIRGALVFTSINTTAGDLALQAPVVRVPRAQRVPVLRLALELSAQELPTARFCLRDDLLVLRFSAPLVSLTPPVLREFLREIGHLAARSAELFAVSFDANPALTEAERSAAGFDVLGRARKLRLGSGMIQSFSPPTPDPIASAAALRADLVKTRPLRATPRHTPVPREEAEAPPPPGPPPLPGNAFSSRAMPPPSPASRPLPQPAVVAPSPKAPLPDPQFELAPNTVKQRPPIDEPIPAILAPMFAGAPASKSTPPKAPSHPPPSSLSMSKMRLSMPELDLDAPSRRSGGPASSTSAEMQQPADRLCHLLRQTKTLASLVLEVRPGTMPWLIRAAVFRAIHEYRDLLPDAVAHLYRCTGMGRDAPEPALLVLDRVVSARAHHPGEKPLAIDPLTSAAQAKEHVGRYLVEIDRAPPEPALRHFLALGALSELLARAKLPAQTELRLRDIVSHAQREGTKQGSIDLMMTALQRITGG